MKFLGQCCQKLEHGFTHSLLAQIDIHTDWCDQTYYHAALMGGENLQSFIIYSVQTAYTKL